MSAGREHLPVLKTTAAFFPTAISCYKRVTTAIEECRKGKNNPRSIGGVSLVLRQHREPHSRVCLMNFRIGPASMPPSYFRSLELGVCRIPCASRVRPTRQARLASFRSPGARLCEHSVGTVCLQLFPLFGSSSIPSIPFCFLLPSARPSSRATPHFKLHINAYQHSGDAQTRARTNQSHRPDVTPNN